jgi:isoleucyl-tRNA synthetase
VRQAYLDYEFHAIYHLLLDLCTVELSAFYLDVTKDRLYAMAPGDRARRSAQTAMHASVKELLAMLAPILSFTAEEAWGYLPAEPGRPASVLLCSLPTGEERPGDAGLLQRFAELRRLRAEVNKALEEARQAGRVKDSLEALVRLAAPPETRALLDSFGADLLDLLKVGRLELDAPLPEGATTSELVPGLRVHVDASPDPKCPRCWNRRADVGRDARAPELCTRCAEALARAGK